MRKRPGMVAYRTPRNWVMGVAEVERTCSTPEKVVCSPSWRSATDVGSCWREEDAVGAMVEKGVLAEGG